MRDATYEIFKGTSLENALWIGTVKGLQAGTDRMRCLALIAPGDYFIFQSGEIVAWMTKNSNSLRPETPPAWEIVIISSDSNHRSTLTEILKRQELEPLCISTATQYRDVLSKQPVDLVFCDPKLSDGDYKCVIDVARSLGSKARIVVTSGQANWPEFLEAMRVGAFDVICKPCRPKDVEWMVLQAKRDDRKMTDQLMTSNGRDVFAALHERI
jgi:ActR/RegA family two-component response regulator